MSLVRPFQRGTYRTHNDLVKGVVTDVYRVGLETRLRGYLLSLKGDRVTHYWNADGTSMDTDERHDLKQKEGKVGTT